MKTSEKLMWAFLFSTLLPIGLLTHGCSSKAEPPIAPPYTRFEQLGPQEPRANGYSHQTSILRDTKTGSQWLLVSQYRGGVALVPIEDQP